MLEYFVICGVALLVSTLTLFSGFGLGTLLMPAFAIFFPVNFAVAATAVVHLMNNLFKAFLVGRHADLKTATRFTIPAIGFAALGAFLLNYLSHLEPMAQYSLGTRAFDITALKLVMAVVIAFFALWDLSPRFEKLAFDAKYVLIGGALSGFFGGLSGLQGALRSAFLIRCGLSKEAFIATGVVSTVAVDTSRLVVYGLTFIGKDFVKVINSDATGLILAGTLAAFVGSFAGARMMKKVTMKAVQTVVGAMLLGLAIALAAGLV